MFENRPWELKPCQNVKRISFLKANESLQTFYFSDVEFCPINRPRTKFPYELVVQISVCCHEVGSNGDSISRGRPRFCRYSVGNRGS
jgi:hypothetical protein